MVSSNTPAVLVVILSTSSSLLKVMKGDPTIRLSYVLVWRNDQRSPTHYYAPYPGHTSAPDFKKFYNDPYTLFEKDLKDIYKKKK